MSTDHVYDGDSSPYEESDELKPVNLYGQSKRDFENALLEAFPDRCVILRSSVIYGPKALQKAGKTTTFLHFVRDNLKKEGSFIVFNDEKRNFIPINNVVFVRVSSWSLQPWGSRSFITIRLCKNCCQK